MQKLVMAIEELQLGAILKTLMMSLRGQGFIGRPILAQINSVTVLQIV